MKKRNGFIYLGMILICLSHYWFENKVKSPEKMEGIKPVKSESDTVQEAYGTSRNNENKGGYLTKYPD